MLMLWTIVVSVVSAACGALPVILRSQHTETKWSTVPGNASVIHFNELTFSYWALLPKIVRLPTVPWGTTTGWTYRNLKNIYVPNHSITQIPTIKTEKQIHINQNSKQKNPGNISFAIDKNNDNYNRPVHHNDKRSNQANIIQARETVCIHSQEKGTILSED